MNLKIGGIYTESKSQFIDIIINEYCFLQFECFSNNNKNIQYIVENLVNNFELFSTANVAIVFTDENLSPLIEYIDGYLGQIDNELLKKIEKKFKKNILKGYNYEFKNRWNLY